jgi:hypothetical protein
MFASLFQQEAATTVKIGKESASHLPSTGCDLISILLIDRVNLTTFLCKTAYYVDCYGSDLQHLETFGWSV